VLRAILFDFDGVIALSEPLHYAAYAEVLAERGIRLSQTRYLERYLALTDRECLEQILEDFDRRDLHADLATLLREKTEAMALRLARGVPLCPGVERFVSAAAERAALAIVSGALRAEILGVLRRAGLDRFFPVVVSAEDVHAGKPDPQGYRTALERLRRGANSALEPRECVAVEDSPKGITAGRAAGMRVIALPHTYPSENLARADRVYASYDDVDWRELEALCP